MLLRILKESLIITFIPVLGRFEIIPDDSEESQTFQKLLRRFESFLEESKAQRLTAEFSAISNERLLLEQSLLPFVEQLLKTGRNALSFVDFPNSMMG